VSGWEDLLAATRPGTDLEIGAESWLVLRRSYVRDGDLLNSVNHERMTITVELVRVDSESDPRHLPTPSREDT
jgi:hypothetical protein